MLAQMGENLNMTAVYLSPPNYLFPMDFEKQFNGTEAFAAHQGRHYTVELFLTSYVAFVFFGRHYMKSRPAFELKASLVLWNILLSVFSLIGAIRIGQELLYYITTHGFHHSVCTMDFRSNSDSIGALWAYLVIYSKIWELGDTVFLVLRKRPVIFLHWYHHVIVVYYVFNSYTHEIAFARYSTAINFSIHFVMYGYYALRALNVRVPVAIGRLITMCQLAQMVIALLVNFAAFGYYQFGYPCQMTTYFFCLSLMMFSSFVVLFCNFYYHAYIKKSKAVSRKLD